MNLYRIQFKPNSAQLVSVDVQADDEVAAMQVVQKHYSQYEVKNVTELNIEKYRSNQ